MTYTGETLSTGLRVATAAAVAALLATSGLSAQDDGAPGPTANSLSLDVGGGVVTPISALDEITDAGGSAGAGIAWHISPRIGLQGAVDYQTLSGGEDEAGNLAPDMTLLHATGGIEVRFFDPDGENPWNGTLNVGAGISNMEAAENLDTGAASPITFDQTYLSFRGSTKLGYQATSSVNVFLEPKIYLVATDREDTAVFSTAFTGVRDFDTAWLIPVHAGVRITLR
jgi:hypothetical protein